MKPRELRVVGEQADLDDKIAKLDVFLGGDLYKNLPSGEQFLLWAQLGVMREYSRILGQRISIFEKAAP